MNRRSFAKRLAGVAAALGLGGITKASDSSQFPTASIELIPIDSWVRTEYIDEQHLDPCDAHWLHTIRMPDGSIETRKSYHGMYHAVRQGTDYIVDFGKFLNEIS